MIDVRELRVGNLVNIRRGSLRPHTICIGDFCGGQDKFNEFEPIPITEETLKKCGFYRVAVTFGTKIEVGMYHISMKGYCLQLLDDMEFMFCHCDGNDYTEYDDITPMCSISYLHELQNLCFNLTKRELEVKL